MVEAVKDLMSSKKFITYLGGTMVCAILSYIHAPADLINVVAGLTGAYIGAQGLADFKKNAPR